MDYFTFRTECNDVVFINFIVETQADILIQNGRF